MGLMGLIPDSFEAELQRPGGSGPLSRCLPGYPGESFASLNVFANLRSGSPPMSTP